MEAKGRFDLQPPRETTAGCVNVQGCAHRCRRTDARKTVPRPSLMKLFKLLSQG
jgi:hypothetical protein